MIRQKTTTKQNEMLDNLEKNVGELEKRVRY